MKKLLSIVLAAAMLLALAACGGKQESAPAQQSAPQTEPTAKAFTFIYARILLKQRIITQLALLQ
jgi:Flp pilus assembly protein TadD